MQRLSLRKMSVLRRSIDVAFGSVGLVIFAPLIGAMIVIARLESGKDGLFREMRHGLYGKQFKIFKIRSLDSNRYPLPIAGLFRKVGMDELPQLLNIIKGDMSIIGPRPYNCLLNDVPGWNHTLDILPGLTGIYAVAVKEGAIQPGPESRALLEGEYVDRRLSPKSALSMDMKIVLRSLKVVLTGSVDNNKLFGESFSSWPMRSSHSAASRELGIPNID